MLLEQLVEKAAQPPAYDWDAYYRWYFSRLTGREVESFTFWQCRSCLTVNFFLQPDRYGKCRNCQLLHVPGSA